MSIYNSSNKPLHDWIEKYRPKTTEDIILPQFVRGKMENIIKEGELTNLLFHGKVGCGKTTMAKMIPELLGFDYMFTNGKSCGIDMLRDSIPKFISNFSLENRNRKVVIIDEAEKMSDDFSLGFNSFVEEYSKNAAFILTTNFPNRLSDAFHSRFNSFSFDIPTKEERKQLFKPFLERVYFILDSEKIEYDKNIVWKFIFNYYPDMRGAINALQSMSVGGVLDVGILRRKEESFIELISILKARKFNNMLDFISENEIDLDQIIVDITRNIDKVSNESIPNLIKLMNTYQFYNVTVTNRDVNLIAFLTEVMIEIIWK